MQKTPESPSPELPADVGENLLKDNLSLPSQQLKEDFIAFSENMLSSLPHPALYIRRSDRIILAANKKARDLGAKVGDYCWREFNKLELFSAAQSKIDPAYPDHIPGKNPTKCTYCLADKCTSENPCLNNPSVDAFGHLWNAFWLRVNDNIYLHYLVDITESRLLEDSLRESVWFLKHTQQVAMIGTYSLDVTTGNWVSSGSPVKVVDNH